MMNEPIKMEVSQQQLEKELVRVELRHRRSGMIKSILLWSLIVVACILTISVLWFPILWIEDTGQVILSQRTEEFHHEEDVVLWRGDVIAILTVAGTAGERILRDELGNLMYHGEVLSGEGISPSLTVVPDDHVLLLDASSGKMFCTECEEIIGKFILRMWPLPWIE